MRPLRSTAIVLAAGLASMLLCAQMPKAGAKPCGCQNMRATSDSPTGTCDVYEYRTTSCELIWGPDPTAKQASLSISPATDAVLRRLAQASANSPHMAPTGAPSLPDVERIGSGAAFWREFQATIQDRVRIDANLYVRSLGFLAEQGDVMERPHIAVGAVLFVTATGLLRRLSDFPNQADAILKRLVAIRQRLVAFTREKWPGEGAIQEELPIPLPSGEEARGKLAGFVIFGCTEFSVQPTEIAQLVKAPWTPAQSRRCRA